MKRTLLFWLTLLPFMWLSAQATTTITVSGNVTDQSGQALANYTFAGGAFGPTFGAVQTTTDAAGAYSISLQVDSIIGSIVFISYNDCVDPNALAVLGNLIADTTFDFSACAGGGSSFCDAAYNPSFQSPTSLTVDFQAFVSGYSNYDWIFGDGNTNFGSSSNVTHTYAVAGSYSTMLVITDNATGCNDTFAIQIQVPSGSISSCDAHFTTFPNGTNSYAFYPNHVDPNLIYAWDFGDGNTSANPTPTHVYNASSGTYNVCLVVSDPAQACQDSFCITVTLANNNPCNINFFGFLNSSVNLQTNFFPSDTSFATYAWDFGDGNTSTAVHPVHIYGATGTYNVCLTVSDGANCTVTWCDSMRIDTLPPGSCDARFTYNTGFWPLSVDFSLLNPGFGIPIASWDFGDGNTVQSGGFVNHTYAVPGTYTVCATVIDITLGCVDSFCQTVVVTNQGGQNCSAYFYASPDFASPNTVHFQPLDTNYVSYAWDFGDGNVSAQRVPSHVYTQSGTYTVCLTVDDGAGCVDSFCTQILAGLFSPCIADFTAIPDTNGTTVDFASIFPDPNVFYTWDFGDGNTATGTSVTHTYAASGTYNVTLSITDSVFCNNAQTQTISTVPNPPSPNLLFGQVLVNGIPAMDITAYLIQYDSVAGTLTAIDTFSSNGMLGFSGTFFFQAPAGDFFVKASLNASDPDYSNYLPTYYGDSLSWTGASMVNAAVFPLVLINLQPGTNPGGPGFIGGLISQGAGKNGPGDPMEGMSVMIMDANGMPVTHTLSHEDGTYELSGLAYGTYTVIVDFWGKTSQTHTITLSEANPRMEKADFNVNEDFIEAVSPTTSMSGLIDMNSLSLYPNPANQKTTLELSLLQSSELTISVSDLSGKQVRSVQVEAAAGTQKIKIQTNDLPEGLYLLNIRSGNEFLITQKLMISRQ